MSRSAHGSATASQVRLEPDATGLRLVAGEAGSVAIEKLERAVAAAGAPAPSPTQPLTIVFAGAPWAEAVRGISAIWMLETVLRMRSDVDLGTACSESGMPMLEAVSKPLVASGFAGPCRFRNHLQAVVRPLRRRPLRIARAPRGTWSVVMRSPVRSFAPRPPDHSS